MCRLFSAILQAPRTMIANSHFQCLVVHPHSPSCGVITVAINNKKKSVNTTIPLFMWHTDQSAAFLYSSPNPMQITQHTT